MSLYIVGNISLDVTYYGGLKANTFWGGAGLNVSLAAARLGLVPNLISVIGEDDAGLLNELKRYIDIENILVLPGNTCSFEMFYSKNGTLQKIESIFGVAKELNNYLLKLSINEFSNSHFHVCCRNPLQSGILLSKLYKNSISYSLDFISSSIEQQVLEVMPWLNKASFIFLNQQEYGILTSLFDTKQLPKIIITAADQPVMVLEKGVITDKISFTPGRFKDVTGAGDVFAGAYLAQYLLGFSSADCIKKAIGIAQISLQFPGIWPHLVQMED